MFRIISILSFVSFICLNVSAQDISIADAYLNYKVSRNAKGNSKTIDATRALLKRADELSVKQLANVAYHLGRMYEETGVVDSAIVHYTNSLKGEPDYTVIHRALGFIYLSKTRPFVAQMNEAVRAKDAAANSKAFSQYTLLVKKALPHLEKYQACEPDEETMATIISLYKSLKDTSSIITLPERLKLMAFKCVSLLEDE